ncbi:MAG: hypothetical protein NUV51_12590 [Sulfuricaulis sp.]|nr:hypothetical protein [Sulfuricaulis sp.]
MADQEKRNWAYVATPRQIHVGMVSRAEFNRIALPEVDHRKLLPPESLLSKTVTGSGVTVVFQFWINA